MAECGNPRADNDGVHPVLHVKTHDATPERETHGRVAVTPIDSGVGGQHGCDRRPQHQIVLDTDVLGSIGIQQLDSGLAQTAYALVSDLVTLARSLGRTDASA